MRQKRMTVIIPTALLLLSLGAGCATPAEAVPSEETASTVTTGNLSVVNTAQTAADSAQTDDANSAASTAIVLSGSTATVNGDSDHVRVSDGVVTITQGGSYSMSGSYSGSIVITAPSTDSVELILSGVDITTNNNAAIYCTQADRLTITLAEGTANTVADAANFTFSDTVNEEPDAAIFSKNDLTIGGTGSLTVTAGYNNGIGTKDNLVITGGTYIITAANHGMRGRDSVTVTDGNITITSGADGIQSNNDEIADKGWISLEGGSYHITAGNDAIQAETTLSVSAGSYTLITGGGSTATPADSTGSYKGLKACTDLAVSGGDFAIDSADDSIHANGNAQISGGAFTLSSGDDAIHADGDLTVNGADTRIEIPTCYEGLEAKTMTIADGIITISSTDDGINIAGGDGSGSGGRFGGDSFGSVSGDQWLLISGGTITVKAGSDAIDINGNGEMTGGTVDLTAAMLGEGQTLDVDGSWTKTSGELTETGGSGFGGPGGGGGGARGGRGGPRDAMPG